MCSREFVGSSSCFTAVFTWWAGAIAKEVGQRIAKTSTTPWGCGAKRFTSTLETFWCVVDHCYHEVVWKQRPKVDVQVLLAAITTTTTASTPLLITLLTEKYPYTAVRCPAEVLCAY